jgi:translation initiation factor IF-3
MFAISREETLAALEQMEEEKLKFYPAHCPKCRRANRIERLKLEFSYPGWRNDIKKMAKEASETPQPAMPAPAPAPAAKPEAAAASTRKKHLHKPASTPAAKPAPKAVKKPANKSTGGTKKK